HAEAVRGAHGPARGARLAHRPRGPRRDVRGRADAARRAHAAGGVRARGRDGVRVLHGARAAGPMAYPESGRARRPVLFSVAVLLSRGRETDQPRSRDEASVSYASRSTWAGSIRDARCAGSQPATAPTAASTAADPASVAGSRGSRP